MKVYMDDFIMVIAYKNNKFKLGEDGFDELINDMVRADEVKGICKRDVHQEWYPPYGKDDFKLVASAYECYIMIDDEKAYCLTPRELDLVLEYYENYKKRMV